MELIPLFVTLARAARQNGLSGFKAISQEFLEDSLLWRGLSRAAAGNPPTEVTRELGEIKQKMLNNYERRLALIMAGIENLIQGSDPASMERNCRAIL